MTTLSTSLGGYEGQRRGYMQRAQCLDPRRCPVNTHLPDFWPFLPPRTEGGILARGCLTVKSLARLHSQLIVT